MKTLIRFWRKIVISFCVLLVVGAVILAIVITRPIGRNDSYKLMEEYQTEFSEDQHIDRIRNLSYAYHNGSATTSNGITRKFEGITDVYILYSFRNQPEHFLYETRMGIYEKDIDQDGYTYQKLTGYEYCTYIGFIIEDEYYIFRHVTKTTWQKRNVFYEQGLSGRKKYFGLNQERSVYFVGYFDGEKIIEVKDGEQAQLTGEERHYFIGSFLRRFCEKLKVDE